MSQETILIETDLTEEEKGIIRAGREEYEKSGFIPLESIVPRPNGTE